MKGLAARVITAPLRDPRAAWLAAAAATIFVTGSSMAGVAPAPVPPAVARHLEAEGFTAADLAAIAGGRVVARGLTRAERDEAGAIGVVRINLGADAFAARVRDIVRFERGPGVHSVGRFAVPARPSDLAGYAMPEEDVRDLVDCELDDCDVNLSAADIARLTAVDRRAPGRRGRLTHLAREALAAYVADYQRRGNAALLVYRDRQPAIALRDASARLLRQSVELRTFAPAVASFLEQYPAAPPPAGAEQIFYWSVMTFGMKPITRANHIVVAPLAIDGLAGYAIASRTIYASHYFRDGLEVKVVVPVPGEPGACYLVSVNRSHSESLTGVKGLLLGAKIRSSARSGVERHVLHVKREAETP